MKRLWKWTAGILGVLFVAAFGFLSYVAGSPKDAYGMVRYALPHMHRGTLKVGSDAPDAPNAPGVITTAPNITIGLCPSVPVSSRNAKCTKHLHLVGFTFAVNALSSAPSINGPYLTDVAVLLASLSKI